VFATASGPGITWAHLLQQTSQWDGELWGKPTRVDAQSWREGTEAEGGAPGSGLQTVASRVHFREQYRALVGHALVRARVLLLLRALSVPGDTV
jgi:hypothetical protein